MISSSQTETTSGSGNSDRRSKLLLEATKQFCSLRGHADAKDGNQFTKLFYSLIGHTNAQTKKLISSRLAYNHYTPRPIAYYLAMEAIDIAAPFLLISPVLWERDLIQLIEKLEAPYLSILARRSDISPVVARALASRGDKLTRQVLSRNPVLKLNGIASALNANLPSSQRVKEALEFSDKQGVEKPQRELLELANVGGWIARTGRKPGAAHIDRPGRIETLGERLLMHARSNQRSLVAREIATQIDMPFENVEKIVLHENSSSLAIFLKGLHLSRSEASQLLLLVNKRAGRNIAEFTGSMEQFDRFTISQCHDIIKNLGGRKLALAGKITSQPGSGSILGKVASARRRQIMVSRSPVLFGGQRKAG